MRHPRRFTVLIEGKVVFIVRAYSLAQARAVIAARIADTTRVTVRPAPKGEQR